MAVSSSLARKVSLQHSALWHVPGCPGRSDLIPLSCSSPVINLRQCLDIYHRQEVCLGPLISDQTHDVFKAPGSPPRRSRSGVWNSSQSSLMIHLLNPPPAHVCLMPPSCALAPSPSQNHTVESLMGGWITYPLWAQLPGGLGPGAGRFGQVFLFLR